MPGVTRSFFLLFAPCAKSVSQLLCNHAFPRSFTKTPGWGGSLSPTFRRWDVQAFRRILAIAWGFAASYAGSRGVMDGGEDEDANSVRSCNAGHVGPVGIEREGLARSERTPNWSTARGASPLAFYS